MAGLLDFLNSDDAAIGLGLLAAGGPTSDPNASGFGARLANAVGYAQNSKAAGMRNKLLQSQIDENASQAELRKAQIAKQAQIQGLTAGLLGDWSGGGTSMGGGSNVAPPEPSGGANGVPPSVAAGLRGVPIERIAALKAAGGPDLVEAWKAVNVPTSLAAGSYAFTPGQAPTYMADPSKGVGIGPQGVFMLPGADKTQAALAGATTGAQEAAKSQYDLVEVQGADGRTYRVPRSQALASASPQSLPPVPTLPGGPLGAPRGGAQAAAGFARGSAGAPGGASGPYGADGPLDVLSSELPKALAEMQRAQAAGDAAGAARAQQDAQGIMRELQRIPGGAQRLASMNAGAAPAPTPAPLIGLFRGASPSAMAGNVSRLSPAEETANEARRVAAVEQARANVVPAQDKQKALNAGNDALRTIDKALNHPGLKEATGLQGSLDPRNYIPGTDARNFAAVRNQLQGQTFLQAYNALKGGGQITEVEGTKAENAIARLDKAQSTPEFVSALKDLRDVVDRGMKLTRGESVPDSPLPSNSTDTAPKKAVTFDTMPSPLQYAGRRLKGPDGTVYRSNGATWVKE